MSYAMQQQGLGFIIELASILGTVGAPGSEGCVGNERADELGSGGEANAGDCCPAETFSDATIRKVLGRDAFLRVSLQRAYAWLDVLLGPPSREGFGTMIEQLAYDTGDAQVGPTFVKQLDRTRLRMHALFPLDGFKEDVKEETKGGCGPYATWRARSFSWTPERIETLARVTGAIPNKAQLEGIHPARAWLGAMFIANPASAKMGVQIKPEAKPWLLLNPRIRDWLFSAYQVISAAPWVEAPRSGAQWIVQVVTAVDGQLLPSPWLAALISVFATKLPEVRVREPQKQTALRVPFTLAMLPVAEGEGPVRPSRSPTRPPSRQPGPSRDPALPPRAPASGGPSAALVGAGALALATGAYLLTRRTRRAR